MSEKGKRHYPEKRTYPLQHGLWCKDLTKRINRATRQWINNRVKVFLEDIPDPSGREIALAEHCAFLDAACRVYAIQILAGENPGSVNRYLSFEGHLQRNLCALGLKRGSKRKVLDLGEYLKEKKQQ